MDGSRRGRDSAGAWTLGDLRRPTVFVTAAMALAAGSLGSLIAACNVHEGAHAVVALALGWEIGAINWCLPAGGGVEYASIGTWAGNAQGYAGGFAAAAFLATVYWLGVDRPGLPLRGPGWWAAGFGPLLWVGPEVVIGVLEGSAAPGSDYGEILRARPGVSIGVLLVVMAVGAGIHVRRWRAASLRTATQRPLARRPADGS